jgi:hypothetical protein
MADADKILRQLMTELENALELDRGPAAHFKDQVWQAIERARRARERASWPAHPYAGPRSKKYLS